MLRSFRVANHKSIRAAQELVLLPAYDKSRPVTPVAAIYGANASGKSNLLDALTWMRRAVLDSFASWTSGGGVPRAAFKLDPEAAVEPSEYVVDLMLDGVRHYYGFVVEDAGVGEEWLHTFPKGRRRVIFERTGQDWQFGSTVRGPLEAARDLTRSNALFLSVAARSNVTECEPLLRWFDQELVFADPRSSFDPDVELAFADDSPLRQTVLEMLRAADLGITDVRLMDPLAVSGVSDFSVWRDMLMDRLDAAVRQHAEAVSARDAESDLAVRARHQVHVASADEEVAVLRDMLDRVNRQVHGVPNHPGPRELLFWHGDHPVPLTVDEESAGTRTWLNLILSIATALARPKVLLVDEADTTLHPHLARHLVNLFRDPRTNPLGAQLIFTSHDATMLDEDTLSRDEIWFVEKDPTAQATRLYSLAEFRPRKHENTERRYLAGSYGAVPVLSEVGLRRALARGTDPDAA